MMKQVLGSRLSARLVSFLLMFSLLFCQLPGAAWAEDAQPAEETAVVEVTDETPAADVEENVADEAGDGEETPAIEDKKAPVAEEEAPADNAVMLAAEDTGAGDGETTPTATHGYLTDFKLRYHSTPNTYLPGFTFDPVVTSYDIVLPDAAVSPTFMMTFPEDRPENLYYRITSSDTTQKAKEKQINKASMTTGMLDLQMMGSNTQVPLGKSVTITLTIGIKGADGVYTETDAYSFNVIRQAVLKTFAVQTEDGTTLTLDPKFLSYTAAGAYDNFTYLANVSEDTTKLQLNLDGPSLAAGKPVTLKINGQAQELSSDKLYDIDLTQYTPQDHMYTIPIELVYTGDDGMGRGTVYTLNLSVMEATPTITKQPEGLTCDKGQPATLSVEATAPHDGTLTYQWYKTTAASTSGVLIEGATSASYQPPTDYAGDYYYYCRVTNTAAGMTGTADSNTVKVSVNLTELSTPTASIQAASAEHMESTPLLPLQATTGPLDGKLDKITFTWYRNTVDSTSGGVRLADTVYTSNPSDKSDTYTMNYTPPAESSGTYYYYCTVTVEGGGHTATGTSTNTAAIKFLPYSEFIEFDGSGTQADPWLIKSKEDLAALRDYVNNDGIFFTDCYLKLTKDIDLDAEWTPIGTLVGSSDPSDTGSGKNIRPFSGYLDCDNHTISFANGSKPLFNYVREASVSNLTIYAPYMDGNGLVDRYTVDYGTDGSYYEGDGGSYQIGVPDTVDIINVTIKEGSVIKGSGFISGYASGGNVVNIINCTVKENVKIGVDASGKPIAEDYVGSFAGQFSGTVINCTSSADVYGASGVGGIVGVKGQSMGPYTISNCAFRGTVNASGDYAGGIVGAGYYDKTAPNTLCVSIVNCYVTGKISGNDMVGGIFGGEPGSVQCWSNGVGTICDNHFAGSVAAKAEKPTAVGGVIGYMNSLDRYNVIANNYYKEGCGAVKGIGSFNEANVDLTSAEYGREDDPLGADADKLTKKLTQEAFADGTLTKLLNGSATSFQNWVQGTDHPIYKDEAVAYELNISGEYKTEYYIGDELDLTDMEFTAKWTDGTTTKPAASEVKIEGYDKNTRGIQKLTAVFGAAKAEFTVTVLKKSSGTGSDNITVYLTLLGDTVHGDPTDATTHTLKAGNLETWIPKTAYTVGLNDTVWDVIQQALAANNMTCSNPTENYIESITKDGVELGEFSNGNLSGWMYTLNGSHPNLGVSEQFLNNGDKIVFHYTDDYTKEEGAEKWDIPSGGGGGGTTAAETEKPAVTTEVKPEVTANDKGEAIAKPADKTVSETIEQAKQDNADAIVIEPEVKGDATKVGVELSKTAVAKMTEDTDADLTVKTDLGNVTVPAKGLEQLTKESGSNVTVTVEAKDGATNVEVAVGGKAVEKVTGGIGVSVPAAKASEGNVLAIINADGTQEIIKKSVVDGKNVQAVLDGSCTVKVIENGKTFADTNNHWGKDAVSFVTARELFNGTSDKAFEPDADMSRAMLATVLWRLEDEQTAAAAKTFADIANGQYYTGAVAWASDKQIVTGYEDGTFAPDKNINREELAAMLFRYAKSVGLDTKATGDLTKFADGNKVSSFATDAMKWAVGSGLMNGKENNTLDPQGNATRAEVATTMQRLVKLLVK